MFVFAGAAAEFALNKAVDWLYFTGKLPADPLGRLFSTVQYARKIVFATEEQAYKAIDSITAIHQGVEMKRGSRIPDWAYRDVLFMLIHYSIASFELLDRKMTALEKEELYQVFYRMGIRMELKDLPPTYDTWLPVREQHLQDNLVSSSYTEDLFRQYRKHLGGFRYWLVREVQILICPPTVRKHLKMRSYSFAKPLLWMYKISRKIGMQETVQRVMIPKKYREQM